MNIFEVWKAAQGYEYLNRKLDAELKEAFKAGMVAASDIVYDDMMRHKRQERPMTAEGCEGSYFAIKSAAESL